MPSYPRIRSRSDIYHIMARGVSRCIIYEDDKDFGQFIKMLEDQLSKRKVSLYAWCLMDNHYHLLVKGKMENISTMMRALNSRYAQYFNERHGRVGHLFQGRFRSEAVESDARFIVTVRYIHQNPLKAGITKSCDYRWSSFNGYIDRPWLVDNTKALELFYGEPGFLEFHEVIDDSDRCIDIDNCGKIPNNEELISAAREALNGIGIEEVAGLPREMRDESLRMLKDAGFTLRQIERLTGVSKSVAGKA